MVVSVKHTTWGRIREEDAIIKPSKRKADLDNLLQVQEQKQTKKHVSLDKRSAEVAVVLSPVRTEHRQYGRGKEHKSNWINCPPIIEHY